MKQLQERAGKRKRPKPGLWQGLTGSHGELREVLERTVFALLFFVTIPLFGIGFGTELLELVPGGSAVWVPVWWTAVFLMCTIGVVLFVTSRE